MLKKEKFTKSSFLQANENSMMKTVSAETAASDVV